jgi:GNAT superfamily N-acetyltransferase
MLVRPACVEDAVDIHRNCFSGNTIEQTVAMVEEAVAAKGRGESVMLVGVRDDGEVVGTCTVTRLQHRMCRHRADVGGFVITPTAQGTGLARKIVEAACRHAASWGCTILEISCRGGTHAEDAYIGLGFKVWGRLPDGYHDHGELTFDEVRLWMTITP